MNKCKLKQTFALLAAMTMMSCAAACSGETEAVGAAGGDVPQITAAAAAESSEVSLEAEQSDLSVETNLPEGMTMDDLKNMIQINGKTLSMPTTLNDILALDEGFSYEFLLEDSFDSSDEYFEEYDVAVYKIVYNYIDFMNAYINVDDRTNDMVDAPIFSLYGFDKTVCETIEVDFSLKCDIDHESSKEDIMEIFGHTEPTDSTSHKLNYEFFENTEEKIVLEFSMVDDLFNDFYYSIESTTEASTETEAELSDSSEETNLPEGMTMDDLKNMIQINGKTLSMPTTLNDILALDEGFSYKLLLEDSFDSIDEYFEEYDVAVYTIYYNDIAVMNANINIDDRTDDMIDAKVYTIYNINASDCDLNGFDFSLSCGIDFTSSKEDIMEIFGYTETKPTKSNILEYVFYDKEQEIALDLHISPETNLLSNFNYFIY